MLELIQRRAARIVSGAIRGTPIANMYRELGWEPLERRRERHKLILFYKIVNNLTPPFLSDILSPVVNTRTRYALRNTSNLTIFRTRTETFKRSFFPSATVLWNSLPMEIRNAQSLASFKRLIHRDVPSTKPWFSMGDRRLSMIHARLRMGCSNLNSDLCNLHIQDNADCLCGSQNENAEHFFFDCPLFRHPRNELMQYLDNLLPPNTVINLELLLNGSDNFITNVNTDMFDAIHKYINRTVRFQ